MEQIGGLVLRGGRARRDGDLHTVRAPLGDDMLHRSLELRELSCPAIALSRFVPPGPAVKVEKVKVCAKVEQRLILPTVDIAILMSLLQNLH